MTTDPLCETVARAIATGLGKSFDQALANWQEWTRCGGMKGGRYHDVNDPLQDDYREAADAALAAIRAAGWRIVREETNGDEGRG